jgi:hypothetical protein
MIFNLGPGHFLGWVMTSNCPHLCPFWFNAEEATVSFLVVYHLHPQHSRAAISASYPQQAYSVPLRSVSALTHLGNDFLKTNQELSVYAFQGFEAVHRSIHEHIHSYIQI